MKSRYVWLCACALEWNTTDQILPYYRSVYSISTFKIGIIPSHLITIYSDGAVSLTVSLMYLAECLPGHRVTSPNEQKRWKMFNISLQ